MSHDLEGKNMNKKVILFFLSLVLFSFILV